jgi:hypothetical protein
MSSNELGSRYQTASRETRLVNDIVEMLATIRRVSEGKYTEALALLQQARVPTAVNKLRQTNLLVLQAGHALLSGFVAEAVRVASMEIPAYQRATLDVAGMDGGLTATSTIPFTMLGADGNIYDAFVAIGTASALIFGAFPQNNRTGTTTNFDQVQAAATATGIVSKRHDQEVFVRSVLAANHFIFPCSINNLGVPVAGAAINGATLTSVGNDRPITRDYFDGQYLWCITQSTAGPSIRVHKVNVATGVQEGYRTITACAGGVGPCMVFANGSTAVVVVEDAAGVLRATYFSIADGSGAGASSAASAGTALRTPLVNELEASSLLISAPFAPVGGVYTGVRIFAAHDGGDTHEALQRLDIYPALGAAGNVSTGILGVKTMAVGGEAAITADGEHIVAIDDTANFIALYDVTNGQELKVVSTAWFTTIIQLAPVSVGPVLANVTLAAAEHILAIGVR